jgi:hypothetical protein
MDNRASSIISPHPAGNRQKELLFSLGEVFVILPCGRLRLRQQSHKLIVEQSGTGIAMQNARSEFGQ